MLDASIYDKYSRCKNVCLSLRNNKTNAQKTQKNTKQPKRALKF